jgi:hypothetical protein
MGGSLFMVLFVSLKLKWPNNRIAQEHTEKTHYSYARVY